MLSPEELAKELLVVDHNELTGWNGDPRHDVKSATELLRSYARQAIKLYCETLVNEADTSNDIVDQVTRMAKL